jgi:hypothetical protein
MRPKDVAAVRAFRAVVRHIVCCPKWVHTVKHQHPSRTRSTARRRRIYPDDLRVRLRDRVAIMGGQRLMPLGYAIQGTMASPNDGLEVERRLCRWVADMHADPRVNPGPWMHEREIASQ